MSNLIILDVDDWVIERLERRAEAHGRPPAQEAKAILQESLGPPPKSRWRQANAVGQEPTAAGNDPSDSAEPIREDRDR